MEKEQKLAITKLRSHWQNKLKEEGITSQLALYIPTLLGFTEKDAIEKRLSGIVEMERFLTSDKLLMLLLGDSGAGKSLFGQWLVNYLWEKESEYIPIFIHLPTIKIKNGFLEKYLRKKCGLTKAEIEDLKTQHRVLLILDSYDEMKAKYKGKNVHMLGEIHRWNAKVLISCRTESLASFSFPQQAEMFVPYSANEPLNFGWEKRYVQAFDPKTQLPDYVNQWKQHNPELVDANIDYLEILTTLPHISEMITNPFILWVMLMSLQMILKEHAKEKNLQKLHLTRLSLFDAFTNAWFERQREKLKKNDTIDAAWLRTIVDDYRMYSEQLANMMWQKKMNNVTYEPKSRPLQIIKVNNTEKLRKDICVIYLVEQDKHVVAHYFDGNRWCSSRQEGNDLDKVLPSFRQLAKWSDPADVEKITSFYGCLFWDVFFSPEGLFNNDPKKPLNIIRSGALLSVIEGNTYLYIHYSLLEYFSCKPMFESAANKVTIALGLEINSQLFTEDLARIRLGANCVKKNPEFEEVLWEILEESKHDARISIAAANAATILAAANRSFAGKYLRRVRIRGANVSGGNFDHTDLQEADLRDVSIAQVWMKGTMVSGSCCDGLQTGELTWESLDDAIKACAFHSNGQRYGVLTKKQFIVYQTQDHSKECVVDLNKYCKGGEVLLCFTFLPKHEEVLIGTGNDEHSGQFLKAGRILRVSLKKRRVIQTWEGHSGNVHALVVSPNGKWVLSGADGEIKHWELNYGDCIGELKDYSSTALAVSPDGQWVLSGSGSDSIERWAADSWKCLDSWEGHTDTVIALVISPDGQWALSGSFDHTIKRWKVDSGQCLATWDEHNEIVTALALNPNGEWAVSGSLDGTIRQWNVATGKCLRIWQGHENMISALAVSPSGEWVLSGSGELVVSQVRDNTIKRWEVDSKKCLQVLDAHLDGVYSLAESSDVNWVLSGSKDNMIKCWDFDSGQCSATWVGHSDPVSALAIYRGEWALSGSSEGAIKRWSIATGEALETWQGVEGVITALVISQDGKWALSGSQDEKIRQWNVERGICLSTWEGHKDAVSALLLSSDGKWALSGSFDNTIKRWSVDSGTCLATWDGHEDIINTLVMCQNEKYALSGSQDNTIKRWEVATGKCLATWKGHKESVRALTVSPDGVWALSGGHNGDMILWNILDDQECSRYKPGPDITTIVWSRRDPTCVVVGMRDGSVSAWTFNKSSTSLSLRWRSKPWSLGTQNSQFLGTYGLAMAQQQVLAQMGSKVQVSTKRSEAIILQREQPTPYNPDHTSQSLFDPTLTLRPEAWVISILRKKVWDKAREKNDPTQHAFLVLESVEDGVYRIRRIDFVLEKRHQYIQAEQTTGSKIGMFGQGLIEIADKSLYDLQSLAPQCCALSQGILPGQGRQLLENIRFAQTQKIGYSLLGAGNMYRMFRMNEAIAHHNCLSWCEEQLQLIDVHLTERKWKDNIVNDPRLKIQNVALTESNNKQNNNNNNNGDDEPSSGSKCILM